MYCVLLVCAQYEPEQNLRIEETNDRQKTQTSYFESHSLKGGGGWMCYDEIPANMNKYQVKLNSNYYLIVVKGGKRPDVNKMVCRFVMHPN